MGKNNNQGYFYFLQRIITSTVHLWHAHPSPTIDLQSLHINHAYPVWNSTYKLRKHRLYLQTIIVYGILKSLLGSRSILWTCILITDWHFL